MAHHVVTARPLPEVQNPSNHVTSNTKQVYMIVLKARGQHVPKPLRECYEIHVMKVMKRMQMGHYICRTVLAIEEHS